MGAVFKYPIALEFLERDVFYVAMPANSRLLSFQLQKGRPTLWAEVDESFPPMKRKFVLRGTGMRLDHYAGIPFVGTIQLYDGDLVLHLFDAGEEAI